MWEVEDGWNLKVESDINDLLFLDRFFLFNRVDSEVIS